MKLLYAEDEPGLSEAVVDILTYYKYQVDAVPMLPQRPRTATACSVTERVQL